MRRASLGQPLDANAIVPRLTHYICGVKNAWRLPRAPLLLINALQAACDPRWKDRRDRLLPVEAVGGEEDSVELQDYLRILRKGWVWIAASVVIAIVAAAAVIVVTTPQYASSTRLFVTTPVVGRRTGRCLPGQPVHPAAGALLRRHHRERPARQSRVIEANGLDDEPTALANQVSARVLPDTVLLDITVTDPSPEDAQALAAAYADEFVVLVSEIEQPPSGGDPLVSASVVNSASVPGAPVSPQPVRTLTLAAILGLLVGIGIVVLRDVLDTTVSGSDELAEISGAPGLGVIAFDPDATEHPLIVQIAPRSPRAEAFRQLRTNLQFVDVDAGQKVIVITSSVPSEGKTTTTVNLALALADAGVRVLLVEGDLRRPRVSEYLGIVGEVGLTNLLVGSVDVEDAVQQAGESGLNVIASGPTPPNPSELLQSQAMTDLVAKLRQRADIVLVDSPPLLPVADAAILSTHADGAILVTRHGHTKTDQIRQAVANLEQVGGRLLGTVLTMTPTKGPDAYRYGYGYGYGEPVVNGTGTGSKPAKLTPPPTARADGRGHPGREGLTGAIQRKSQRSSHHRRKSPTLL